MRVLPEPAYLRRRRSAKGISGKSRPVVAYDRSVA